MKRSKARILVSWYADPRYIPPFELSEQQVVVGPKSFPDQPAMMFAAFAPVGSYDLKAVTDAAGIRGPFDAVAVWADASGINLPLNLQAFGCPTVLCVGDTQHLKAPLTTMIDYAKRARFDFVVSSHNRQHLHWFEEAGFANVAWLPGLKVKHTPRPSAATRRPQIVFAGNATTYHARRMRLMEALATAGLPLIATRAPREACADLFAGTLASFNASLNGDLNLRVFEVLSSGGCLFTDRLAPESGMAAILDEDKEFIGYGSVEECVDKARFLLGRPDAALSVAKAGHEAFVSRMLPERRVEDLLGWIFESRLDSLYRAPRRRHGGATLGSRLRIYEVLQELHRLYESPKVLFLDGVAEIFATDALDLTRLDLALVSTPTGPEIAARCRIVDRQTMEATQWDALIACEDATIPATIRARQKLMVPQERRT